MVSGTNAKDLGAGLIFTASSGTISAGTAGVNGLFVCIEQLGSFAEGQVRAYQSGADTIVEFNTSGAGGADMAIDLLDFVATSLTSDDFFE